MNFAGKRALVTGAAGGIGGSITSMLRSAGARVAVTDRNTDARLTAEAHFPGDLTDPSLYKYPARTSGLRRWVDWIF